MLNENYIQTSFGILNGISASSYYPSGCVKDVVLNEKNMIVTHVRELIPYYGEDNQRRKYKSSVTFFNNELVKSVSLNEQTDIQTPIGEFPAELVTFYETGELKRVFILDGKITGFWTEEDERNLNIPFSFDFDFTKFSAMLVGICFYKTGDIRSITLFPKEVINVSTKNYGDISVKTGFSLYENGLLKSIEPAVPTPIQTPIGVLNAYDVNSLGINADSNSIEFDEEGRLVKLITSSDKIAVQEANGVMKFMVPIEKKSPLDEKEIEIVPLKIIFNYDNDIVTITDESSYDFSISKCKFNILRGNLSTSCTPEDCASCKLCSK